MGRILPVPLGRPLNIFSMPHVGDSLPTQRPGYWGPNPEAWIPGVSKRWQEEGIHLDSWSIDADLLLAPYPRVGEELVEMCDILRTLPDNFPVALYEREVAFIPNLLMPLPESARPDQGGLNFQHESQGLRAYRAAFRHMGKGETEAYLVLPARRLSYLLRGSFLCEIRPGQGASLQNRRFLIAALDHQRTLLLGSQRWNQAPKTLPSAKRVAVVMPHFDDDVLQCGGAMQVARAAGAEVRVIWLTDGAQGIADKVGPEATAIRKEEARAAMAHYGIDDLHFMDAPETKLARKGPWTNRLRRTLEEFAPDRVHTVWWADNNVDHFEANRVLQTAWPRTWGDTPLVASGIWTPLSDGTFLPLAPELREAKDQATLAYPSQLEAVNYLRSERGLSRWYARNQNGVDSAECYWVEAAADYWQIFNRCGITRRWFIR